MELAQDKLLTVQMTGVIYRSDVLTLQPLFLYVLLRVDPNITIVFFYQPDAQILYFNAFITFLYMFRALMCSSSGGQIVLVQHLVSSLSLGQCFSTAGPWQQLYRAAKNPPGIDN